MLPETPDVLIAAGTLFASVAAFWGAYSAFAALSTWKRQLVMKADQDLALRILKELSEYRDALLCIKDCYQIHTDDQSVWENKSTTDNQVRMHRWRRAQVIGNRLEYACHEADMFWPREGVLPALAAATQFSATVLRKMDRLKRVEQKIDLLPSTDSPEWEGLMDEKKALDEYFDSLKYEEDQFFSDLRASSNALENFLVSKARGRKVGWMTL